MYPTNYLERITFEPPYACDQYVTIFVRGKILLDSATQLMLTLGTDT